MLDGVSNFSNRPKVAAPTNAGPAAPLPPDLQKFLDGMPPAMRSTALASYDGNAKDFSLVTYLPRLAQDNVGNADAELLADAALKAAKPLMSERDWEFTTITVKGTQTVAELRKQAEASRLLAEARAKAVNDELLLRDHQAAIDNEHRRRSEALNADSALYQHLKKILEKTE